MGKAKQRRTAKGRTPQALQGEVGGGDRSPPPIYNPSISSVLFYAIKVIILCILSSPFYVMTNLLSFVYGMPPKVVRSKQTRRFIRYAIECKDITFTAYIELLLTIISHSITSHISGFCWLIDEILYSKQLNAISINKTLFVLSAYRTASTEMARALAKDKQRFVAPNAIMCAFPYLWVWKLITYIVGDDSGISTDEMNVYLNKNFTKESLERHDNDHFAIDTFDGYWLSSHLNGLAFHLGPNVIVRECNSAIFEKYNQCLFENDFVEHVDRLAKKTLLFNGIEEDAPISFLLKGHFLLSAQALQRQYPDARFLTVLRDPLDRLKSGINHMAVNATLWQGRPPRWDWLTEAYEQIEVVYCAREMDWYNNCSSADQKQRLAIRFDAFVKNFDKTMKGVYRDLLLESSNSDDTNMPMFTPPEKVSKRYSIDKSLKELGVDEAQFKLQLADYYAWMKKQ